MAWVCTTCGSWWRRDTLADVDPREVAAAAHLEIDRWRGEARS